MYLFPGSPATRTLLLSTALTLCISTPSFALDARSAALGGSAIANGKGVHGALENPATLMRLQREKQRLHFHIGAAADVRDDAGYIDKIEDEEDLPTDLEDELDALSGSTLTCDVTSTPETVCLTGTQNVADLSQRVLDLINDVDGKPASGMGALNIGFANTGWTIPMAFHYQFSVSASGQTNVAESDREYIQTFIDVLSDDQLTAQELLDSVPLSISGDGQTLDVLQPEEALESESSGSGMSRQQFGISLAMSKKVSGFNVDFGVTPKFSQLRAASLSTPIADQFQDDSEDLSDQFEENESTDSSFNVDLGATLSLNALPARVSVVARNLLKEEIETNEAFVFETTPQLIVGGAFDIGAITLSADLALNEAKIDNFETQIMSAGIEFSRSLFAVRAGLSNDMARNADASALSLGVSLGPLHVGGRLTDTNSAQASAQIAFSF